MEDSREQIENLPMIEYSRLFWKLLFVRKIRSCDTIARLERDNSNSYYGAKYERRGIRNLELIGRPRRGTG